LLKLRAPFPWFGGKSRASSLVWSRFGNVLNYVEPFAGSLAVLLNRPDYDPRSHCETVNDLDCYLANFWRSLSHDPAAVAHWADYPVSECDLHARHLWLINQESFRESMKTDPDFYDLKIAGWWVWGLCQWIGGGWCSQVKRPCRQLPHLGNKGRGVHRKLPHLGDSGRGVHRKLPHLGDNGGGNQESDLLEYFEALASRLRRIRVCNGDWMRVLSFSVTDNIGLTGVFLDPPYDQNIREKDLYAHDDPVSVAVKDWAIAHGDNPLLRIALCGYSDEFTDGMPDGWECVEWKAAQGYGNQKKDKSNQNSKKERIWFSPSCLKPSISIQATLFDLELTP